ncbi:MAG: transglutaminase family protein [Rubripirellula sp.]
MTSSARYRITHQTRYQYSSPVAICQNQLRMMPRSFADLRSSVDCDFATATIAPEPTAISEHEDYFGNRIISFAIETLHRELVVTVRSEVSVHHQTVETANTAWENVRDAIQSLQDRDWYQAQEYLYDSPRIQRGEQFSAYALESFSAGRDIVEANLELTQRIHDDFRYDTTATHVGTPTEEAFTRRAGVCQDFAHIQIACRRSIGLPARYVSGYLRTIPPEGQPRLIGADESHAWLACYAGESLGWLNLDPTNACLTNCNHVPICIGRDYSEVSPMRGVVLGGGTTKLQVNVDVEPIDIESIAS